MKKAVLAIAAVAVFTAPALAADMAAKAPLRAAPVAYAPSFTGCYVGGGGGYGLWNQENTTFQDSIRGLPRTQVTDTVTTGGRGWFGTVQGGCDYQFSLGGLGSGFVFGVFGDYDFADIDGRKGNPFFGVGNEKLSSQWAVGGRVGWVALPSLLVYFSGGYTEAKFDRIDYTNLTQAPFGVANGFFQDSRTYQGWFLGAGDEYALNFLPGLFWKTEYRLSRLDTETIAFRDRLNAGLPTGFSDDSRKWVHTVRSELVYRFNWSGVSSAPVAARY